MVHFHPSQFREATLETAPRVSQPASQSSSSSFAQQLSEAFSDALQKVGIDPGSVQITGQNPDASGKPSQFIVSMKPQPVDPFAAAAANSGESVAAGNTAPASSPPPADPATPAAPGDSAQMTTLKNALKAAGIDPGPLNLQQVTDFETRPFGGSYTNHYFQVQTPKGSQLFDVDMTMLNPQVTVVEIQNLMNPSTTWV